MIAEPLRNGMLQIALAVPLWHPRSLTAGSMPTFAALCPTRLERCTDSSPQALNQTRGGTGDPKTRKGDTLLCVFLSDQTQEMRESQLSYDKDTSAT